MKRSLIVSATVILVSVVSVQHSDYSKSRGAPLDCDYCKCSELTGVLVANRQADGTFKFSSGWWYYERNPDGTSGAPIENAAVRLHYTGEVDCVDEEASQDTGTKINRYKVDPPDPLPCTAVSEVKLGHNMEYAADTMPPSTTPEEFDQVECIPPEE